jgi:hypothetical protein
MRPSYCALIDTSTHVLLTLSSNVPVILFLNECMPDTLYVFGVNYPKYQHSFPLSSANPDTYPEWAWDHKSRTFSSAHTDVRAEYLRKRSVLATKKRDTISDIMRNLNSARYPVWTGVVFQDTVYMTKKIQAQAFKDAGYPEDSILEYPYVMQYADFANISVQQAADDIIFKAQLDDDLLFKTEMLRLKYFNRVKEISDVKMLPIVLDEFLRECFGVAIK